jgi:ubiquinone/menaquinone biosynthesis C-methylase UbiE
MDKSRKNIIASFRQRSVSYYEDNYLRHPESERNCRLQLIHELLRERVAPGMRVLEVGAGPAVLGERITASRADYVAMDLSRENLAAGRQRLGKLRGVAGDAVTLPFGTGCFDVVAAIGCLEYMADDVKAISELCRVVRRNGVIIASFANILSPRRWWDELIIHPLVRLKKHAQRNGTPHYRRHLSRPQRTSEDFANAGAEVQLLYFCTAGLLGYPLSMLASLRRIQELLSERILAVRRAASEFVVIAKRR